MKVVRYAVLTLLAAGGILIAVEGALIGLGRVWLSDQAPLFLQVMLPGMIVALGIVIGLAARNARRSRRNADPVKPDTGPAPDGHHAGLG